MDPEFMTTNQWLDLVVVCIRCQTMVKGRLGFSVRLNVTDSEGFMLFDNGPICDTCIGESN